MQERSVGTGVPDGPQRSTHKWKRTVGDAGPYKPPNRLCKVSSAYAFITFFAKLSFKKATSFPHIKGAKHEQL